LKKFLIIRLSSIGDIVLTTPVVRCLKNQISDAEVHFITKKQFFPVIEANPYIDKTFVIQNKIEEVIPALKAENYDYIIDLHRNFRSKGIRFKLQKKSAAFNKINIQKWLIVNFKIDRLPDVHIVDRYFETIENLGVKNDNLGLDYFIPERDEITIDSLPIENKQNYIGWVIGGKHQTKIFPENKIVEVIKEISKPVVLIGGPEDSEKGEWIKRKGGNHIFNACGKFNLNQSASLVRNASLILTNDTGLMHVAAAFRKNIISFWGNTIPQFGMYPYMPGDEMKSDIVEINNLSCRPCSKLGYNKCPKKHFDCMNKIEIKRILELIRT